MTDGLQRRYPQHGKLTIPQWLVSMAFTKYSQFLLHLADTKPVRMYDACVMILREPKR